MLRTADVHALNPHALRTVMCADAQQLRSDRH
jgi:hypothetical protein